MKGVDVFEAFRAIGATSLHHSNTVTTSSSFLELGGLASRAVLEAGGLPQTPQNSDELDKKFGIWNCIFVDHVDIHNRGGRIKGPNQYGPVLFQFDLELLRGLPEGSEIFVTRKNPTKFVDGEADIDRWFQSIEELTSNLAFGDYNQMIVIQTPTGTLGFPNQEAHINLDQPQRLLPSGEDAYTHATTRIAAAAARGRVRISIHPPNCRDGCICTQKYGSYQPRYIQHLFG